MPGLTSVKNAEPVLVVDNDAGEGARLLYGYEPDKMIGRPNSLAAFSVK